MEALHYRVLVERKGFAFFVDLDYENLPEFCTHCNMVGHYLEICRKVNNVDDEGPSKEDRNKNKQKKVYVQTRDGNLEQGKKNQATGIVIKENQGTGNIIDNDDAENNLLEELEKDDHIEAPFQVVQSKKKAKNQKNNTSKSSYSTRSKAGTSKPFR